jgi:hypothetical protein
MATIYSLICWGGKNGKSVTANSTTDRFTLTNHGLRNGTGIQMTGGTAPAGTSLNTTYYAKWYSNNEFEIYSDAALTTRVLFSSNGASIVMKSAYYLGLADKSRWTYSGTEYIYDGIVGWNSGRAGASALNIEVAEIGMAFTESVTSSITPNVPSASREITTKVNGVRSSGFHGGVVGGGYVLDCTYGSTASIYLQTYYTTLNGFSLTTSSVNANGCSVASVGSKLLNMIVWNYHASATSGTGVAITQAAASHVANCLIGGFYVGLEQATYVAANVVANNTIVKCTARGFYTLYGQTSAINGYFYNNISVGNVINWNSMPTTQFDGATNNAGVSGDTVWAKSGATTITMATTDFVDYSNNDFRPASNTSPQVDTAVGYSGIYEIDLKDSERPSYNNGGAESFDIGAYEYDKGFGPHPNTVTVSGSGIAIGTRVKIAKQSDGTEYRNEVLAGTTDSYTQNASSDIPVYIYARKGSATPFYKPVKLSATIKSSGGLTYSLDGLQIEDIARGTSYPSGVATDFTVAPLAHVSGTTRYNVQDLYSYHQDYYDDSATVDDLPLLDGTTPNIFRLINGGTLTATDIEYLKGGSIEFGNGDLWSNIYTVGGLNGSPNVYIYQGTTPITQYWAAGHVDILLKVKNTGTLISSGLVTCYARKWGYTYDHYEADLSAGGRNVAPLSNLADANIVETTTTVSGWTDVTVSFGTYSLDFADGAGEQSYYCRIDCNNRPLAEVYQRLQYITREGSSTSLNGVTGDRYQSAHSSIVPNKAAPFGAYSGGVLACAQGIWLDNVPSGDSLNYIITDNGGGSHQNTVALNQSVTITGVVSGSRVQIYDTTNNLELLNTTSAPYYWEDPSAPVGDRVIRVRIAKVSGATAYNFIEQVIGTCGTSESTKDVSYLASQTADAVYNSNAVDGSTVTGITIVEGATDRVQISISGGSISWPSIYAYCVYWLNTETGIQDDGAFIAATDTANYTLTGFKIKNTHATQPLMIIDGYGVDSTGSPSALYDVTGTSIFPVPEHVVAKIVSVGGANIITGDVADVIAALPASGLTLPQFLALK